MTTVSLNALFAATASLALVGLILWTALRARHLVAAGLVTVVVSLIWTSGLAALTVGYLNVLSVAFAVLIIGLGVDFGIHFCMRYAELVREGGSNEAALEETTRDVGGSLVLCAFTTAMSFFVFIPTDYKAVGELGLIAGAGMMVSLFTSLTVLPALLTVWQGRAPGRTWSGALWFERVVVTAAAHHPRTVRWTALGLGLASLAALPLVHFDHNVSAMRDPSTESVQTFDDLLEESDTSPWTIDVMAPDLDSAVATAKRLRELEVVEQAVTLADYVPEEQEEKVEILSELGYFVPTPPKDRDEPPPSVPVDKQIDALRALVDSLRSPWLAEGDPGRADSAERAARHLERFLKRLEALESGQAAELARFEHSLTGALPGQLRSLWLALDPDPVTLETLPGSLTRRMRARDGRARIEVLPAEDLSDNVAHARFVDEVKAVVPDATGSAVTLLEFGRAVVSSFLQAVVTAGLAVALLLLLLWRRLSDMLLVLAPLTLAALMTTAAAGVLGISFNFGNVVVIPLLLGIGVDSGIHLVHRHRVTLETRGVQAPERELLETSTAQAVFFSALTTMASFGSLSFSAHVGFASLGQLLVVGVAIMLLANLILLPALLALRGPEPAPEP